VSVQHGSTPSPYLEWRAAEVGAPSRATAAAKRIFDVVTSGGLLLVGGPVWIGLAAYVKCTSRGPVFFGQTRLGKRGVPFRLYKFRTMCPEAEAMLDASPLLRARHRDGGYKLPDADDSRITPAGRVLRRCGLDEVPQLFNVLRGEMSLVGPRPIVPDEAARYREFPSVVQFVRPGITGPWQLRDTESCDYHERATIDRRYAERLSLSTDLMILLRTLRRIARIGR